MRCPLCGAVTEVLGQHEEGDLGGVTWGCPRCRVTFYLIAGVQRQTLMPED